MPPQARSICSLKLNSSRDIHAGEQSASGGNAQGSRGLERLLTTIFESWSGGGISFLILRNYENLPRSTSNDIDVLLSPQQSDEAERLMVEAAAGCGFRLHNRVEFATLSCFLYDPVTLEQIQIDLFSTLRWHALELLSVEEILRAKVSRGLFSVPHPAHEAVINLITRLVYQGIVREKYREGIRTGFTNHPREAEALLAVPFGSGFAVRLSRLARDAKWTDIEALWRPLRRTMVLRQVTRHPLRSVGAVLGDLRRGLRRVLEPGGLCVAVLGPDGSGKSTIAGAAVEQMRNTFNPDKMLLVHWKPVVFFKGKRRPSGKPTLDPHAKPPRNRLASLAYLVAHWLEFLIGSHVSFRRTRFKNGLVVVDRYHYDFLVDQRRYRLNVSKGLIRLLFPAVKDPDLVFLFDAPVAVLQARKQEVSAAETARQAEAFREIVTKLPQGRILDATRPVAELASAMTAEVLRHLYERTCGRYPRLKQLQTGTKTTTA